jgi:hypothetical protein
MMPDNVKPVKGVGFTEEERKLCIKALMTYRDIVDVGRRRTVRTSPFLPPSEGEKKTIDLLIGDFKGPSWD